MSDYEPINDADHGLFGENTNVMGFDTPEEVSDRPSQKYGMKLAVPVMFGFILLSGVFVAIIIYCSKRQEAAKKKVRAGERDDKNKNIRQNLVSRALDVPTDDGSSVGKPSSEAATLTSDVEEARSVVTAAGTDPVVFQNAECALCSEPLGDDRSKIYESNNPACNHCFHAKCMDKWLQYQNTCPTCNQPFAILKY